jgi:PAS domain S-box-containing protein
MTADLRLPENRAEKTSIADFGLIFQAAAEPMLVINPAADLIRDANPAACRLLGHDRAALRAMRVTALHPGQLPALIVFSDGVLAKGEYRTRGLKPHHASGRELLVECAGSRLGDGAAPDILLIVSDLAALRKRETDTEADLYVRGGLEEWQRIERFFRDVERENQLILRAAGEGIYGVNADGKTTFVNPAAERMLGFTAGELVGKDMHSIVHHTHADGSHYPAMHCPIYAAFRDGAVHQVDNEVFWRKDGSKFFVEYTSTPIRDRGSLIGAVIVFRDITQRREADEKLRAALAEVEQLRKRLEQDNEYLQEEIRLQTNHRGIIGVSAAMQKILRQIELVAPTEASVLITGESGTGKELIARAIHDASKRSHRPLIRVNCAAVARDMFESEFFGHARGALAGAMRDRPGRFELADGGTLFLDEIGDIPLDLQGKLLRVLQEGQFERVGEARTRNVDVRVIAATNRNLSGAVRSGLFREDLYFRLNVFPIDCVPLRERTDDVPALARHFLQIAARKLKVPDPRLTEGDMRRLVEYSWPGNVRELQNVIERAAILARNGRLRIDLPVRGAGRLAPGRPDSVPLLTDDERRERDRANIVAALDACGGKVFGPGGAAELLNVKPTTLASRIKALGITVKRAAADRP